MSLDHGDPAMTSTKLWTTMVVWVLARCDGKTGWPLPKSHNVSHRRMIERAEPSQLAVILRPLTGCRWSFLRFLPPLLLLGQLPSQYWQHFKCFAIATHWGNAVASYFLAGVRQSDSPGDHDGGTHFRVLFMSRAIVAEHRKQKTFNWTVTKYVVTLFCPDMYVKINVIYYS